MSIALHTSVEEGDLSSDRLSHLKIVGSGFGPLIYGLKNDPSFESFQQGCEHVWKAIDQTPNLPRLLVSSSISVTIWKIKLKHVNVLFFFLCRLLAIMN